jgi:hypothetical protein
MVDCQNADAEGREAGTSFWVASSRSPEMLLRCITPQSQTLAFVVNLARFTFFRSENRQDFRYKFSDKVTSLCPHARVRALLSM